MFEDLCKDCVCLSAEQCSTGLPEHFFFVLVDRICFAESFSVALPAVHEVLVEV